jgi:DNA-directed RNA polymerase subunit RPC12/RpoP
MSVLMRQTTISVVHGMVSARFCQRSRQPAWSAELGPGYMGSSVDGSRWMRCADCGSSAVSERPERTVQGYRRFRCRACGKQFNEHSLRLLNRPGIHPT